MKKRRKQPRKKAVEKKSVLWIAKHIPVNEFTAIVRQVREKLASSSQRGYIRIEDAARNFQIREQLLSRALRAFYRKNKSIFAGSILSKAQSMDSTAKPIDSSELAIFRGMQPPFSPEKGFRWEKDKSVENLWILVPVPEEVALLPKPQSTLIPYPSREELMQRLIAAQKEVTVITEFFDPKNEFKF